MSNLVIDSSVAIKWFVAEAHAAEAARIFDDYLSGRVSLLAPDFIYAEFGNIVWKKQAFQNFDPVDAARIVDEFRLQVEVAVTSSLELIDEAYPLAVTYKRTVYDCLYLALSLRSGCRFVTADERLVNALGANFPNVIWLANWP